MVGHLMRDDLFYRLNEITITLPPLRERIDDIPLLCTVFVAKYNTQYHKSFPSLSPAAMERLLTFTWPGNVRQLENLIKQIVVREDESIIDDVLSRGGTIHPAAPVGTQVAMSSIASPSGDHGYSLKRRVNSAVTREEKSLISEVLRKTNWNRRKAAEALEISYRSLLYKIKEYGLSASEL
jgi:two-component system response regulator AtoC